jgi:hypothetical protein
MKSAASDAEARRREKAAQIRSTDCLLMAADELGDLERCQQPVRQSARRGRRIRR